MPAVSTTVTAKPLLHNSIHAFVKATARRMMNRCALPTVAPSTICAC